MTQTATDTRSIVIERDLAHPPERVWRALTQPHLIAEWLMNTDFAATIGHRFRMTADWGAIDCEVLELEPNRSLSYSWVSSGLDSVVVWTLTPAGSGTHLRLEQSGFQPGQQQAFQGAKAGWPRFLAKLEEVLASGMAGDV